jgi:hypothetical protein
MRGLILNRLVAFPESKRILRLHLGSTAGLAMQLSLLLMVPVLLRKQFGAGEWETTVATSASSVLALLAIFWNELYRRMRPTRYLLLVAFLGAAAFVPVAVCDHPKAVLLFVLVAACGMGGNYALGGEVLRSCYPPGVRSKVFGLLKMVEQLVVMLSVLALGFWLDRSGQSYRIIFPVSAVIIGVGYLLLQRITRQALFRERLVSGCDRPLGAALWDAYRDMRRVLREDVDFRRYETAFCCYGLGWMICFALLPFLVVDVLRLNYAQVAWSTQGVYQLTLMLMMVPCGYLMERIGAIRTSAWSFVLLVAYPVLLVLSRSPYHLAGASVLFGIGMAGVNLAWTIGPVSLARSAADAGHYLAIHATLVAVRALLGQFPAVALYKYTGRAWIPLGIAAVLFGVAAVLMARLQRDRCTAAEALVEEAEPVGELLEAV